MMQMKRYNIYAGLGGGFGGPEFIDVCECSSQEEADGIAYGEALQIYENCEGFQGLPSMEDCLDEVETLPTIFDITKEDLAQGIYNEYIEDWIEYYAILEEEDMNEIEDEDDNEIEEF